TIPAARKTTRATRQPFPHETRGFISGLVFGSGMGTASPEATLDRSSVRSGDRLITLSRRQLEDNSTGGVLDKLPGTVANQPVAAGDEMTAPEVVRLEVIVDG